MIFSEKNFLWNKYCLLSLLFFLAVLLSVAPNFLETYSLRILTTYFMWIGLAVGWNIFNGYTGHIDFGYVVYFGTGAYATSLLMIKGGVPFLPSVLFGGLMSLFLAFILSIPTLRLKGAYFAIATWTFAETMKQFVLSVPSLTEGSYGISLPPTLNASYFYYLMFACMVIAMLINFFIEKIKLGYNLKAIRDAETAAESLGINIFKNKVIAFVISAFLAGMIGGIYAYWITYVHPYNVYDGLITDRIIVMVLIGGRGTLIGPIIGVILLRTVFEVFWTNLPPGLYLVFLGLIIIVTIMFLPNGIVGTWKEKGWKLKKKFSLRVDYDGSDSESR